MTTSSRFTKLRLGIRNSFTVFLPLLWETLLNPGSRLFLSPLTESTTLASSHSVVTTPLYFLSFVRSTASMGKSPVCYCRHGYNPWAH